MDAKQREDDVVKRVRESAGKAIEKAVMESIERQEAEKKAMMRGLVTSAEYISRALSLIAVIMLMRFGGSVLMHFVEFAKTIGTR